MGYFVAMLIIISGFVKKNSRVVTCIQTVYMWVLIALNYSSADYWSYEEMYRLCFESQYSEHEIGYMALCKICLQLGLSYTYFRCLIAFLIVFFTVAGFNALTNHINIALSMYLLFGFNEHASTMRNAVAVAILIFAIRFLIYDYARGNVKYFICICFAMLFHYSACFYLLFLLCRIKIKPAIMGMVVLNMGTGLLLILKSGIVYWLLIAVTGRQRTIQWFSEYDSLYVSPLYVISFALICVFLFLLECKMRINCNNACMSKIVIRRVEKIIILSLTSFVLAISSSVVWLRMILAVLPIGYAGFSCEYPVSHNQLVKFRQYNLAVICLGIFSFLFVFVYWIGGNVLGIFENNYLFVHL